MAGKIELVLPGLFDLPLVEIEPGISAQLNGLNRILRLATAVPNSAFSIDAILRRMLTLESPSGEVTQGLPLAQAFASSSMRPPDRLLLFRAVHLQPDLHSAIVVPIQHNDRNINDISIIINDLKDLFKVDCDIVSIGDGLYLMALHEFDAPSHYPHLLSVLGKAANPYIEQSRENLSWYKLLNEMQMFMHQHDVNQQRQQQGLLPLNSLWFWGGGERPRQVDNRFAWSCDDPVLSRFARSLECAIAPTRDIAELERSADALVVDLRLLELLKTGDASDIGPLLLELENNLLQPLLGALERDRKRLYLRAGYDFDFELGPRAALKFWRRSSSLEDWLGRNQEF